MRFVTLVNRTNDTLEGVWDGVHHRISPGKHSFPEIQARKFKEQNPVMGSEDPRTGDMIYKLGIEEDRDPTDDLGSFEESVERWDRSKLAGARPTEVVRGDNGLYQMGRTVGSGTLPLNNGREGFVNPNS